MEPPPPPTFTLITDDLHEFLKAHIRMHTVEKPYIVVPVVEKGLEHLMNYQST